MFPYKPKFIYRVIKRTFTITLLTLSFAVLRELLKSYRDQFNQSLMEIHEFPGKLMEIHQVTERKIS